MTVRFKARVWFFFTYPLFYFYSLILVHYFYIKVAIPDVVVDQSSTITMSDFFDYKIIFGLIRFSFATIHS